MINRILRWLCGYVIFVAKGKFPERLINLALVHEIMMINPKGEKGKLTAQTSIHGYYELYALRKNADVTLKIQKKVGLPFFLHRNTRRKGIFVGMIFFVAVIRILSLFIWTVNIHGNKSMSVCEIQNALQQSGIYAGALKKNINIPDSERNFELITGKVGWISLNIIGSNMEVEISESYDKPNISQNKKPANLKARKSGQILKMNIANGKNMVAVGDGVAKGQLLVSGIFHNELSQTTELVHSDGEVFAGVAENFQTTVNKTITFDTVFEQQNRRVIRLLSVKFPLNYQTVDNVFTRQYVLDKFSLNNTALPFEIITEENFGKHSEQISIDPNTARNLADIQLSLYEIFALWNSDIKEKSVNVSQDKSRYCFIGNYYCIEDIADCVEIEMNNKE